jgi:hypothetical protein
VQGAGRLPVRQPGPPDPHRHERVHGEALGARLIGAPPGYVGYEEGGYLTEAVRRKPYSVILLDEVEKAHPDVFNVLLQVLDDGRMTDGQGRTVDFKNTVIVMTSNLGSQMIQSMAGDDYQVVKLAVMGEVKTYFRPEFINRIDEVVVFHALGEEHIANIARIQLQYLEKRVAQMDMKLEVSDAALLELAKEGFDPVFGARPLKRAIQQRSKTRWRRKSSPAASASQGCHPGRYRGWPDRLRAGHRGGGGVSTASPSASSKARRRAAKRSYSASAWASASRLDTLPMSGSTCRSLNFRKASSFSSQSLRKISLRRLA